MTFSAQVSSGAADSVAFSDPANARFLPPALAPHHPLFHLQQRHVAHVAMQGSPSGDISPLGAARTAAPIAIAQRSGSMPRDSNNMEARLRVLKQEIRLAEMATSTSCPNGDSATSDTHKAQALAILQSPVFGRATADAVSGLVGKRVLHKPSRRTTLHNSQTPPPLLRASSECNLVDPAGAVSDTMTLEDALNRQRCAVNRLAAAVSNTRTRLQHTHLGTLGGPPAAFLQEITSFVETQLQLLEKQFPARRETAGVAANSLDHDIHHCPTTTNGTVSSGSGANAFLSGESMTLTAQEYHRRLVNHATLSAEERRRKLRLDVFVSAQRMFAENFRLFQPFLDMLTDEHIAFHRYLIDDLELHKEVILGLRRDAEAERSGHAGAIAQLEASVTAKEAALEEEKRKIAKWRAQVQELASKDMKKEHDVKRHIHDLEVQLRAAWEENGKLRESTDILSRENQHLSLTTFSDAVEKLNMQIAELRAAHTAKDDQLLLLQEETSSLSRDVKLLCEYSNAHRGYDQPQLSPDVIRLSAYGNRIAFPDEYLMGKPGPTRGPQRA